MNIYKLILVTVIITFSTLGFSQTKILALGDSLTEGHNLAKNDAYPQQLENLLHNKYGEKSFKVINGGISGSTTASGKSRMKWYLKAKPEYLLLALGANDGLRGFKLEVTKNNLEEIIKLAQSNNIKVILFGMRLPPNYGLKYTKEFNLIFKDLALKYKTYFYPFMLKDVAGKKDLNLADGIHPNKKGYEIMAKNIFKYFQGIYDTRN